MTPTRSWRQLDPRIPRGKIIRAIDMPLDGQPPTGYEWVEPAFDDLRARNLTDAQRLAEGVAICERPAILQRGERITAARRERD